jgi:phage FluMu protein Com
MRCTKCGKITHDYLDNCSFCGTDLKNTRAMLGFHASSKDFSWFDAEMKTNFESPPANEEEERVLTNKTPVITDIDVSDLLPEERHEVNKEEKNQDVFFEIDHDETEKISSDALPDDAEKEEVPAYIEKSVAFDQKELEAIAEDEMVQLQLSKLSEDVSEKEKNYDVRDAQEEIDLIDLKELEAIAEDKAIQLLLSKLSAKN